ncbi:MAG: hypothetical protein LUQ24_07990 [Methanobacterium sp.]|nr:hypothetical protein [Methanobacterium sp.]
MFTISSASEGLIQDTNRKELNDQLVSNMQDTFDHNLILFKGLTRKINSNYYITVTLYIVSFIFGLALLSIPIAAAYLGGISTMNAAIGALAGIVDIAVVLLFKPVERIHELMADFSQITVITSSYQEQVGLRLLELDVNNRDSMGVTADKINQTTKDAVSLIQDYCEAKAAPEKKNAIEELITKIQEYFKKKEADKKSP